MIGVVVPEENIAALFCNGS